MISQRHYLVAAAATAGLFLGSNAQAVVQTVGGTNVWFKYDDAMLGLFGTPTVVGDSIFFTPTNFVAQSLDGAGTKVTAGTLNIRILPKANYDLNGISFTERGDYLLRGAGSSVGITGQIRVFDVNNFLNEETAFFATTLPMNINDGNLHNWAAVASVSLADAKYDPTTEFNLTLQNRLTAFTQPGVLPSEAFIEKKFTGGSLVVTAVPEPELYLLMSLGVAGLAAWRRRKSSRTQQSVA